MIAHIDEAIPDRESQPDAARSMTVGACLKRNSKNFRLPAYRNGVAGNVLEPCQNRLRCIDRRTPNALGKPQCAGMIDVAVAEDDRIDVADRVKIRQSSGLGALAAIEQQPASVGLHHEGCRLLGTKT